MFFRKQKASGHEAHDKAFGNDNLAPPPADATLIARGTRIDGNIASEGEVRVEGRVKGMIDAMVCTVAEGGRVEGEVSADDVYVQGTVRGPIKARHVHLMAEGTVEGDISCDTIAIETGARLSARCGRVRAIPPKTLRRPSCRMTRRRRCSPAPCGRNARTMATGRSRRSSR